MKERKKRKKANYTIRVYKSELKEGLYQLTINNLPIMMTREEIDKMIDYLGEINGTAQFVTKAAINE